MKRVRYWLNLLVFALSFAALGLIGTIGSFTYQKAIEYPRPSRVVRAADDTPAQYGVSFQDITLTTTDGLKLSAWYTPSQNGAIILAAHGYGSVRHADLHALFAKHGYGVVTWDFRAHGLSEGDLSTIGYYEVLDVEAALDFALKQPNVKSVGAWGESMGAATSIIATAKRPEIKVLVADSPFATLEGQLNTMVKWPVLRPFVRFFAEREAGMSVDKVRPIDHVARVSPRPLMLIHGLADDSIPLESGQLLYQAAGEPKILWEEPGVGHVQMWSVYPAQYEQKVIAFFDKALLK